MVLEDICSLLKKSNVEIEEFKKELGIDSNSKLLNSLLINLEKEIEKYDKEKDYSYLLKSFRYISKIINSNEKILPSTFDILEQIKDKTNDSDDLFLKEVSTRIEDVYSDIEKNFSSTFQEDLYGIANTVVFDLKDRNFFKQFLLRNPRSGNLRDNMNNSLLYNSVLAFLKSLDSYRSDKNKLRDVSYYNMVINSLVKSKGFTLDSAERSKILDSINEYICTYNDSYNSSLEESSRLWLNNLKNIILSRDDIKLEELNIMFGRRDNNFFGKTDYNIRKSNRRVVDDYVITIDPVSVNEVDDGLSIRILPNGNYLLGVHIADPTAYFRFDNKVLKEAKKKSNTLYFEEDDITLPIFPQKIIDESLSLEEGKKRFATSYYMEVDRKNHDIIDFAAYKTIVKTDRKLTYDYVDCVISGEIDCDEKLKETIMTLMECCSALSYKMEHLTEDDKSDSSKLVEKCMVAVGCLIGNTFYSKKWPMLYRVHNLDNYAKFREILLNRAVERVEDRAEKRQLEGLINGIFSSFSAYYSTINRGHFGLSQEAYVHATSPLRRSADLYVADAMMTMYFNPNPTDKEVYRLEQRLKRAEDIIDRQGSINDEYSTGLKKILNKKCTK